MKNKLRRWEIALMAAIAAALFSGLWLQEEQAQLAQQMIRLHVIAHSDREEDQQLKLMVRDRILEEAQIIYDNCNTLEQAEQRLKVRLSVLEQAGQELVTQMGYSYPVSVELTQCWFPTKEYDDFSLPAGEYKAVRVIIGEGRGRNWWCVAFPPLCVGAASYSVEEMTQAGYFTKEQQRLMVQEEEGYILKFKSMELLGELRHGLTKVTKMDKRDESLNICG